MWCWGTREDLEILRLIFLLFLLLHGLLSLMHAKTRQRSDQEKYGLTITKTRTHVESDLEMREMRDDAYGLLVTSTVFCVCECVRAGCVCVCAFIIVTELASTLAIVILALSMPNLIRKAHTCIRNTKQHRMLYFSLHLILMTGFISHHRFQRVHLCFHVFFLFGWLFLHMHNGHVMHVHHMQLFLVS